MNLFFDNIIFSLQQSGGISVVWYEILNRLLKDPDINIHLIDTPNQNYLRKNLSIPKSNILKNSLSKYPLIFQRYLNPSINGKGIFHSSYYRTTNSKNIINITTVHDFTYEYYRKGLPQIVHSNQKYRAIKKSQKIICVSENTKRDLLKFYPKTDENKIRVVYNGVDDLYHVLKKKNKEQLGDLVPYSVGEYALYIGDRISKYKKFNIAVKACKETRTPLVMVGGGNISNLEHLFLKSELGENNYSHLSGIINEQLNFLYNHALCLLYPSVYEGFGIPVIEAQKAGCPVIAVNISSIPEVIGPVSTLLNKPSADNMGELINQIKKNSGFTISQIEVGLKNSNRFSWDKCYQETKQIYKELYEDFF